jgi:hypothetical protein
VERHGGDQGQCRRGGIGGAHAHQGADVEIAGGRDPGPPLPPLAAGLAIGAQPQGFGGAGGGAGEQIVVGRAGFGDCFDSRQWPLGCA